MLIKVKATLRLGDTVVPSIFMCDRTHLPNFCGDKIEWLVCMIIGNLSSKSRPMPSAHRIVMVTLLPIPIQIRNDLHQWLDKQRQTNREVLNNVLWRVLQPLTFKQNPNAESGYYNVLYADGSFRRWKPVLAAWLADCPEFNNLNHLERHVCFCVTVQWLNLDSMSLLTSNTLVGITTYRERSVMPTTRQLMPNYRRAMSTQDSRCFDIFPVLWATSWSPTSSIQCRSVCLTTLRSRFSTSWGRTNSLTGTMQSGYPCRLTNTSH